MNYDIFKYISGFDFNSYVKSRSSGMLSDLPVMYSHFEYMTISEFNLNVLNPEEREYWIVEKTRFL